MLKHRDVKSDLSRAYAAYRARLAEVTQPQLMGWVSLEALNSFETLAKSKPKGQIATLYQRLLWLLADQMLLNSDDLRRQFEKGYAEANILCFPATSKFLSHCDALKSFTQNYTLLHVDITLLRLLDFKAHDDPTFSYYVARMCAKLDEIKNPPDAKRYSQFFEIYAEASALAFLRSKLPTRRIAERETPTPDFECELGDRRFYVEVKALDVVDGEFRHDEMMVEAIDAEVELQTQLEQGKNLAIAEGELAPFKRFAEKNTYDPRSLIRVIDTFRSKCRHAFKPAQFNLGPTVALVMADRLILPGGRSALVPYYFDRDVCVSGVLWQAAFGRAGGAILSRYDFEGKPAFEGYLSAHGLFVDEARPFPAIGLITFGGGNERERAYGLYSSAASKLADWQSDDTEDAFGKICDAYNDDKNCSAWGLSRYTQPIA